MPEGLTAIASLDRPEYQAIHKRLQSVGFASGARQGMNRIAGLSRIGRPKSAKKIPENRTVS